MEDTLHNLASVLGNRRVAVGRELTKLHETFHRGRLGEALSPPWMDRGEAVVLIEQVHENPMHDAEAAQEKAAAIALDAALTPKERSKRISLLLGISAKEAYANLLKGTYNAISHEPEK